MGNQLISFLSSILHGILVIWPVFAFIGIVVIARSLFRIHETKRMGSGANEIDTMDGKTFAEFLEDLFGKLGYQIQRASYMGDYGVDLVASKNGVTTVIQAKRHKNKAGIKDVQEVITAKDYYNCQEAVLVVNSSYTKQATELAHTNKVKLWDRNSLVIALLSIKKDIDPGPNLEVYAVVGTDEPE